MSHLDEIEEISVVASKQAGLEKALDGMRKEWIGQRFKLIPHKASK